MLQRVAFAPILLSARHDAILLVHHHKALEWLSNTRKNTHLLLNVCHKTHDFALLQFKPPHGRRPIDVLVYSVPQGEGAHPYLTQLVLERTQLFGASNAVIISLYSPHTREAMRAPPGVVCVEEDASVSFIPALRILCADYEDEDDDALRLLLCSTLPEIEMPVMDIADFELVQIPSLDDIPFNDMDDEEDDEEDEDE
jgi:hypothetical protein